MRAIAKDLPVDFLDLFHFVVGEGSEFAFAAPFGEHAAVLAHEHDEVLREAVGHLDGFHDSTLGFVLAAQEVDLLRQIVLNGASNAFVKELCLAGAVEIAIEIGGVVCDLDVPIGRCSPVDEWHERGGMALKRVPVIVDSVEHNRRNREDHSRRRELPFGENMVNQAAMKPAVAVLVRMDIDEAESRRRRLQNRINIALTHTLVCGEHTRQQTGKVVRTRADEFR